MERWNKKTKKTENRQDVESFLTELIELCKKNGFSISHEDCHGAFIITENDPRIDAWIMDASIDLS